MAAKQAAAEAAPKGKGKMKLLLLIGAGAVVLLGGGGAAAYFTGFLGKAEGGEAHAGEHAPEAEADAGHGGGHGNATDAHGDAGSDGPVDFVDLPDVVVNLQSEGRRMRFLKLRLAVELKDKKTAEAVQRLTPRVMDSLQLYLRALRADEVEGAAGLQKIKEEMMARLNIAVDPHRLEDVLVKEMLVQ